MMKTKPKPDEIDKYAGVQLRVARRAAGLSMQKLADIIGIAYQQVQKYEAGTNRISAGRLWQLANVLGVSVLHFFPGGKEDIKNEQ